MAGFEPRRGLSPVSVVIGLVGLAVFAALWLTHVHATANGRVLDCGQFLSSWIHGSRGRPCQSALNARFAIGLLIAAPTAVAAWAVQLRRNGYLGGRKAEPTGTPRSDLRVGARVGTGRASYPLARLSATPDQAVIRSPVGSAVIERSKVEAVRQVSKTFRVEIVFDTVDGSGTGLGIYSREPDEILAVFSRLGWPVGPPP